MARQLIKDGPAPSPAVISRRCFRIEATFCVWNVQSCTQLSSLSCFFKLMYSWRAIKKKRACNLDCQKKKIIYSVYHNFSLIVGSDNSFSIKYVIFDREMNSAKEDMFHSIECCDVSRAWRVAWPRWRHETLKRLCYTLGTVFNPYPMYGVARILWNAIHQIDVDEEMHSRERNSV